MSEVQRELEGWTRRIVQRLRTVPEVRASLAGLDRTAQADRLAELTVRELQADPAGVALMRRARVEKQAGGGRLPPAQGMGLRNQK
jgi:hypothetical protein